MLMDIFLPKREKSHEYFDDSKSPLFDEELEITKYNFLMTPKYITMLIFQFPVKVILKNNLK